MTALDVAGRLALTVLGVEVLAAAVIGLYLWRMGLLRPLDRRP